jgi:hypothetical protein
LCLPAGKTVQAIGFIAAVLGKTGGQDDHNQPELQVWGAGGALAFEG